jgi:hypothetical protein
MQCIALSAGFQFPVCSLQFAVSKASGYFKRYTYSYWTAHNLTLYQAHGTQSEGRGGSIQRKHCEIVPMLFAAVTATRIRAAARGVT